MSSGASLPRYGTVRRETPRHALFQGGVLLQAGRRRRRKGGGGGGRLLGDGFVHGPRRRRREGQEGVGVAAVEEGAAAFQPVLRHGLLHGVRAVVRVGLDVRGRVGGRGGEQPRGEVAARHGRGGRQPEPSGAGRRRRGGRRAAAAAGGGHDDGVDALGGRAARGGADEMAHTLRLVPPPLLWVVVEANPDVAATARLLRTTGLMYRHLTYKDNFTVADAAAGKERHHQRNVALGHIEHHRLAGVVLFAGLGDTFDLRFFDQLRQIR